MAINFHPKPGMVLMCDFRGTVVPEICKNRPVVIISAMQRTQLSTIVPLNTKTPTVIQPCHIRLRSTPFPSARVENWAKCDLVMTVSHTRLDRVRLATGQFVIGVVSAQELNEIRIAAAYSFGVDRYGRCR